MGTVTPRENRTKCITGSLRYERKRRGLSQQTLADAIGMSATTVNGWEGNAQGSIGLDDAWAVADVLEVSLDQLAGRDFQHG